MRAALYSRVSTADRNTERQTFEMRDFVERRGWSVVAEEQEQTSRRSRAGGPGTGLDYEVGEGAQNRCRGCSIARSLGTVAEALGCVAGRTR